MKHLKKMMALALTMVMVLSMSMAVFAAGEGDTPAEGGDTPAAATVAYDHPLTVTGLTAGDTVKFYKVIEWVGEATDNVSGWKAISPYDTVLTKDVLTEVLLGKTATQEDVDAGKATKVGDKIPATGITSDLAGELAKKATGGVDGSVSGTTATLDNAASGMWMALVTPADANTVYNPVFVSADYNKAAGGTVGMGDSYNGDAVAKKSTLTLTKTAKDKTTVDTDDVHTTAVGDTIDFTVNTTIPGYGDVYDAPHFVVTDTLTALALKTDTVEVTTPSGLKKKGAEGVADADADYEVSATTGGYTITFTEKYLKTLKTATDVVIEYDAIVTSAAEYAVNEESNDVQIEYSHNPNQQSDYDVKKDTTQHYTFSIDAQGAGSGTSVSGKKTSEVVKIGVNADGSPITETTETSQITNTETWEGPLEGAVFGLFTDKSCAKGTEYKAKNADGTAGTTPMTATTGADGRMNFAGLDAGTYYLKEISAPAGFVTNSTVHTIVIAAETESVKVTEYYKNGTWSSTNSEGAKAVTYDTDILKSYTVTIDGTPTATYTFTNEATSNSNEIKWEEAPLVEKPFQLENTKGLDLPSTGGIGTTLFYIIGAILVLGAGILLVTRRRMSVQ